MKLADAVKIMCSGWRPMMVVRYCFGLGMIMEVFPGIVQGRCVGKKKEERNWKSELSWEGDRRSLRGRRKLGQPASGGIMALRDRSRRPLSIILVLCMQAKG